MYSVKNMKRLRGLTSLLTVTVLSLALISGVVRAAVFTVNTPSDKIIRSGGNASPSVGSTSEFSALIVVGGSL